MLFRQVFLSFFLVASSAAGATHHVDSAKRVEWLIQSGRLSPGDTVLWADNEYTDESLNIEGVSGTPSRPISLRAATAGGVVLRGESQFRIGAQWWVIDGFHFDGRSGGDNSYNTLQFRSNGGTAAKHVRLTNCAMTNLAVSGSSSKWVLVYGRYNRVDHCHFSGKRSKGALITVELGYLGKQETAEHLIEWNYFGDFSPQDGTDNETIRVGFSGDQDKPATCRIEHNLFVRCNGDNEIVGNKSSFNTYFANTFRQCNGALVLRHGHHARVESNYFLGEGTDNAGGIRVADSNHVIVNNYLQDLGGTDWNSAFSILGGKQASGGSGNGYQAVDDIVVAHNSIINCRRSIYFNDAKGSRPPTGVMANNLVSSSAGPLVLDEISPAGMKWVGNLLYGASVGAAVDAISSDPQLKLSDGLLRPGITSAAVDAASEIAAIAIETDIDGQLRPQSRKDIGADEVAGAQGSTLRLPLEPADVGVSFRSSFGSSVPGSQD